MAGRFFVAAAVCPLALAFSNTAPLLAWSSYPSKTLDRLPSNAGHSRSLLQRIATSDDLCEHDAVILIEQEGLHATDLRTLSPSSKLVQILSDSPSQRQFQYLSPNANLASTAEDIATRCGFEAVTLAPASVPGQYTHGSRNVCATSAPASRNLLTNPPPLAASQLAAELVYLATTYPKHLVVYTGAAPALLSFSAQHATRQVSERDSTVFDSVYSPNNHTLPAGGILKRYQLLTPGLIIMLIVAFFILVPVVLLGFKALASIQSPLRVEAPKGFSALEKKSQ
ncbi:hypothetical protein D9615_008051 [Tricholomella constricta]|uniref:Protein BIG1 n=1 Tax=Tricholomella constricta TaxID=117010 RepID=A0A8H5LWD5_9AGAR|nr:hypothetical protein D9615_008051 [Tricholomella constricta]